MTIILDNKASRLVEIVLIIDKVHPTRILLNI